MKRKLSKRRDNLSIGTRNQLSKTTSEGNQNRTRRDNNWSRASKVSRDRIWSSGPDRRPDSKHVGGCYKGADVRWRGPCTSALSTYMWREHVHLNWPRGGERWNWWNELNTLGDFVVGRKLSIVTQNGVK